MADGYLSLPLLSRQPAFPIQRNRPPSIPSIPSGPASTAFLDRDYSHHRCSIRTLHRTTLRHFRLLPHWLYLEYRHFLRIPLSLLSQIGGLALLVGTQGRPTYLSFCNSSPSCLIEMPLLQQGTWCVGVASGRHRLRHTRYHCNYHSAFCRFLSYIVM